MTTSANSRRPPRVIHIVESLDVGAIESWLLCMLKAGHTFGQELDWTFYSILPRAGRFDETARGLGAVVINSPVELGQKVRFMHHLRRTLRAGAYDVLHCHHDVMSAVYLVASAGISIPRRIVHVHNADLHVPTGNSRKSALLREPLRQLCLRLADRIVGISRYTLENFLRGRRRTVPRDVILYYGIDTAPYHALPADRQVIRQSLALPAESRILLFVGRMVSYKNPLFLVDVLAEIAHAEPDVFAVFAGAGPLEQAIRERANALGVGDRVRILGWRDDTLTLMQVSDVFVFPRTELVSADMGTEGLGLVVIEAQAVGLPSLLSHGIPEDAIVLPELCETLSLDAGSAAWGATIRRILARPRPDASSALSAIENSAFSLKAGFNNLATLHRL